MLGEHEDNNNAKGTNLISVVELKPRIDIKARLCLKRIPQPRTLRK
jgi:hypothetical protein